MVVPETTILTCSYNTPDITLTMLKSFVSVHGDGPHKILISENSNNEDTSKLLDENGVKYIRNPGSAHSQSIDALFKACTTRFALMVDTDIIFTQSINKLADVIKQNNAAILGSIQYSRGGYLLHNRIDPCFCLIDLDLIKQNEIKFHDQKRIDESKSNDFYKNIPINYAIKNTIPYYDVGSTFYEDILKNKLMVVSAKQIDKYYKHYEGCSWRIGCGNKWLNDLGHKIWLEYQETIKKYENVCIKNKFI